MKVAGLAHDWLFIRVCLCSVMIVCNLLQDYITPCGFPVTPVTGQAAVMTCESSGLLVSVAGPP